MFGFGKKAKPLDYAEQLPFVDPVAQAAFVGLGLPMAAYVGGTGILVHGSLAALEPAVYIPFNAMQIVSPYGRGYEPNYPPVQQVLTAKPKDTGGNL